MTKPLLFIFLFCFISFFRGQLAGDLITKEQFEKAFEESNKKEYLTFPSYSFLFAQSNDKLERSLVPITPWCLVILEKEGHGMIDNKCMETLDKLYKADEALSKVMLVYRCYKGDGNADYDLHMARIEEITGNEHLNLQNAYNLHFTLQKASNCTVTYVKDDLTQSTLKSNYIASPTEQEQEHYLKTLTKERFEQAFIDNAGFIAYIIPFMGYQKELKTVQSLGYLFNPALDSSEKILAPIEPCLAILFGTDKALVTHGCATILEMFKTGTWNEFSWKHLYLAYRCYLLDNPKEYELETISIDKIEKKRGQTFIYFQPKVTENCRPVWKQEEESEYHYEL